jgi:hypothetical protein
MISVGLIGQQSDSLRRWSVQSAAHYGFLVPHREQMKHLIQGHSFGMNLTLSRPVSGKSYWHYAYNLPEQGLDLSFINTGNMRQMGVQLSASYLLNLPLRKKAPAGLTRSRHFKHWLGLGIGMGYATRSWNLETNHQAAVLGSPGNVALTLQYSARVLSLGAGEIRTGLRISHLSNGAFQLPNLGTNNVGVFLSYSTRKDSHTRITEILQSAIENWRFSWSLCGGLKEIPPPLEPKHLVVTTSVLAEKRLAFKSSLGLGADLLNNTSLVDLISDREGIEVPASRALQVGAIFSYTLHLNDFELKMQQGFYLFDRWKVDGVLYHRFGLRYRISDHWFAQLTLKTHYAKADYGEFGFGYSLNR